MEEAFGPYARGGIYEHPTPMSLSDKIITGVSGIILFGLLLAILGGWL
jgi:hypothetical protein